MASIHPWMTPPTLVGMMCILYGTIPTTHKPSHTRATSPSFFLWYVDTIGTIHLSTTYHTVVACTYRVHMALYCTYLQQYHTYLLDIKSLSVKVAGPAPSRKYLLIVLKSKRPDESDRANRATSQSLVLLWWRPPTYIAPTHKNSDDLKNYLILYSWEDITNYEDRDIACLDR